MKLLNTDAITTVGQLKELLDKLPDETALTPFGSGEAVLAYDEKNGCAYLDEESFLREEFGMNKEEELER